MKISKNLALLFLFLFFVSSQIFSQDFDIKSYDIDIILKENGALKIKETIDVFFTKPKHGIYKDIPTRYTIEFQPHLEKARYKFLQNDLLTMPVSGIKVQPQTYKLESQDYFLRIKRDIKIFKQAYRESRKNTRTNNIFGGPTSSCYTLYCYPV